MGLEQVRDGDKVGGSRASEEPACGTSNVAGKLNVGMRRFCSVGKVLVASLGGKKSKTEVKSRKLFSLPRNFVTPVSPRLSEDKLLGQGCS